MSDFLFAMPSFWSGISRLVDLGANFDCYNESRTPEEADARALYTDFRMVGEDLRRSFEQYYEDVQWVEPQQLKLAFEELDSLTVRHVSQE